MWMHLVTPASRESMAQDGPSQTQEPSLKDEGALPPLEDPLSLPITPRPATTPDIDFPHTEFPQKTPTKLGDFFTIPEEPRLQYSDWEIREISRHLKENGRHTWSHVPRLYTVLRTIGQLQHLDAIVDQGIGDIWLPFNMNTIPPVLSSSMRNKFLEAQPLVLTKAVDLEKSEEKQHAHFGRGEIFPFDVLEKLGRGRFGTVDKIFSPLSRRDFARKRFERGKGAHSKTEVQNFRNELQVLKKIQHHHCIELVASYTDAKYFGLIMSPVADCNLNDFYALAAKDAQSRRVLRGFYGCLASGLCYLHSVKIRHRDIKPDNILVKGSEVYLTDFGISLDWEHLSRSTTTDDSGKSWIYCAPEVARYEKRNSSSDIWSLGCVFLEMVSILNGQTIDSMRLYFKKHSDNYRFYANLPTIKEWTRALFPGASEGERQPLSWTMSMLQDDSTLRPSAEDLLTRINGTNFSKGGENLMFCGECCAADRDGDSTAHGASDNDEDGAWVATINTESTSPQLSDYKARSIASSQGLRGNGVQMAISPPQNPRAGGCGIEVHNAAMANPSQSDSSDVDTNSAQFFQGNSSITRQKSEESRPDQINNNDMKIDFCGYLPVLHTLNWRTPSSFLNSLRADLEFMANLRSQAPEVFNVIYAAALEDAPMLAQSLIENGLDVYYEQELLPAHRYPICEVMEWGQPGSKALFCYLTKVGAKERSWPRISGVAIYLAATRGCVWAIEALQQAGEDPDIGCLLVAVRSNQLQTVQYLIEVGKVRPDQQNHGPTGDSNTPLWVACDSGHSRIVRYLLELSVVKRNINRIDHFGGHAKPLLFHAVKSGQTEIVRLLLASGANPNRECPSMWDILYEAIEKSNVEVLKSLIDHGTIVWKRFSRDSPLKVAKTRGNAEVVSLIEAATYAQMARKQNK